MTSAVTAARSAEPIDPDPTAYMFPDIPSEEAKIAALKLAYKINGNSMVGGLTMIDLTKPIPVTTIKVNPAEVIKAMPPTVDKPVDKPVQKAEINTCTRHGLRKVVTGSSWRCRK
jgi:hypothetical protein